MLLVGGVYGSPGNFDTFSQLFIIVQLVGSSIILIYLDEMVQKGWGLGSGIAIFIAASIILQIFGSLFSVQPILEGSNDANLAVTSNRGIFIALIAWATQRGWFEAIQALFFRYDLTNAINLPDLSILSMILAFVIFIIVIYLESMNIEVPISDEKNSQINYKYSVKLFYFTVIPLILTYTIFTNIYFIAQLVWRTSGKENTTSLLVSLLGKFKQDVISQQYVPTSGLVYFLTPPRALIGDYGVFNPIDPLASIIRAFIYSFIVIGMCVVFTIILLRVHGVNTHDITQNLLISKIKNNAWSPAEENIIMVLLDEIQRIIIFGGLVLGILAAFASCLAPFGSGISIILVTSIISHYVYIFVLKKSDKMQIIGFYRFKE